MIRFYWLVKLKEDRSISWVCSYYSMQHVIHITIPLRVIQQLLLTWMSCNTITSFELWITCNLLMSVVVFTAAVIGTIYIDVMINLSYHSGEFRTILVTCTIDWVDLLQYSYFYGCVTNFYFGTNLMMVIFYCLWIA